MVSEKVQRVSAGLAELIRLVNDPTTTTADARTVLVESKTLSGQLSVLQADAAALVAGRERHGDGGAGVLAEAAGLRKGEAAGQVKTVERLESMPAVRDALESGDISMANAKTLATAGDKTSAEQVQGDAGLLAKAAELSPEQFAREAGRWAAQRQHDDGEDQYRRQRARRKLKVWDGDDGMVHLYGELDPVTGAKMHKRLLKEAERLRRCDVNSPHGEQRSRPQRLADALDTLTSGDSHGSRGRGGGSADIAIVQHLTAEGDRAFAEIAGSGTIPQSVFEEHMCNARFRGVVFSSKGVPLWQGHAKTSVTDAQRAALIALYGACGGCGAHYAVCDGHHIDPVSRGGPTNIDNLMLACWGCHQKIHHHGWRVVPDGRGLHTIAPPERIRHGPAHAPDPPPAHGPPPERAARARRKKPPARLAGADRPLFAAT